VTPDAEAITAALRDSFPATAPVRTTPGTAPGHFNVELTEDGYRHIGGAHQVAAVLGVRLGTAFGVDGVTWEGTTAVSHLYVRGAR
jgi:hypothetical protein